MMTEIARDDPSKVAEFNREELLSTREEVGNLFKVAATLILMCSGGYEAYQNRNGNSVAAFIVSVLVFCSLDPIRAARTAVRPNGPIYRWSRNFANSSFMELYRGAVENCRLIFSYGDAIVRFSLLFLAVGGSALLLKLFIHNFQLLFPPLDLIVKRVGPALAISSILIYLTYVLSKRLFALSFLQSDSITRRYEFPLYISTILFTMTTFAIFYGFPVEGLESSSHGENYTKGPVYADPTTIQTLITIDVIWLLWWIAFAAILLLRFFDSVWRERLDPGRH
jgi:hypothetical protein